MNGFSKILLGLLGLVTWGVPGAAAEPDWATLQQQFRQLPVEARRLTGPLFWLHGDESRQRLEMYVEKVAEGGNGCFTAESRPHVDWLGKGWYRDLDICLQAAKKYQLKMWIFDEKWWPSQGIGGMVPPRYAAKRLAAEAVEVEGPRTFEADGHSGQRYIATVAGRCANAAGKIDGGSLLDLAQQITDGKLRWQVPAGKWKIMKFSHVQAPGLGQHGGKQLSVDGASKDCVDWFLQTVYQPHYDRFKDEFGKTIPGFFYDEPETRGDWGTELNRVLAEWGVDWKKAYVAYKFQLAGEEQAAARYQYLDAFADTWGRTMYGGITTWCHAHGVKSMGHFMEHASLYVHPDFCAGDMMRLQGYSDMGGIDAVFAQFVMGQRDSRNPPVWQTPKLASSISHVFGKPDDVAMVEIFGARGQDLTYREMKWWTDHMQVSGVNYTIPHSFNPRAPYDSDCPPYFYNGGYEPRWPLYRIYADYTSRLSLLLSGGRHVCPVAILFGGNTLQVGKMITPEAFTTAVQDAVFDCDWLPFSVLESPAAKIDAQQLALYGERYRVLVVPPVEVIPHPTLAKVKSFLDAGGIVVGYGLLPTQSATIGKTSADIAALRTAIWGDNPACGTAACRTNAAGGRAYYLPETPTAQQVAAALADAGVAPVLGVFDGDTSGWLHALHRVKSGRDVFLVCNQNHEGDARRFTFRVCAPGVPECWDPMRNECLSIPYRRTSPNVAEFSLSLEPNESVLLVFQPQQRSLPVRLDSNTPMAREPIAVVRDPARPPAREAASPGRQSRDKQAPPNKRQTRSPLVADPFHGRCTIPGDLDLARYRVYLEVDELPLPELSAAVTVNGAFAGGMIGKPFRLNVDQHLKPGENTIGIVPVAPKSARLVFYAKGAA